MATDLVERVARAIARATIEAAEPEKDGRLSDASIDEMVENLAVKFYPEARAAIAAMPSVTVTDAMIEAGWRAWKYHDGSDRSVLEPVYLAMRSSEEAGHD